MMVAGGGTNDNLVVTLESTICGTILIHQSEAQVKITNSILDGKGSSAALTCYKSRIENSTIFGKVKLEVLELASNTMFTDLVTVNRRQTGCVRFCYILEDSVIPRCYRCLPEYFKMTAGSLNNDKNLYMDIVTRFPFEEIVYGRPGYMKFRRDIAPQILEGADNGSEIGVFNHLYLAPRIKNLKASLEEYLRFGMEAGIFLVT